MYVGNLRRPEVVANIDPHIWDKLAARFPDQNVRAGWPSEVGSYDFAGDLFRLTRPLIDEVVKQEKLRGVDPSAVYVESSTEPVYPGLTQRRNPKLHTDGLRAYIGASTMPTKFLVAQDPETKPQLSLEEAERLGMHMAGDSLITMVTHIDEQVMDDLGLEFWQAEVDELVASEADHFHMAVINQGPVAVARAFTRLIPLIPRGPAV